MKNVKKEKKRKVQTFIYNVICLAVFILKASLNLGPFLFFNITQVMCGVDM